jgi:Putative addiction module component
MDDEKSPTWAKSFSSFMSFMSFWSLMLDKHKKPDAWAAELERRAAELESGAVQGIAWEDLRERLSRTPSQP